MLIALLAHVAFSQQTTIQMSGASNNQTFNTCNGFIIDSGGQGGPGYSNNETVIVTICPDTPGDIISVVFNLFQLSTTDDNPAPNITNVDYMDVYDGNSTAAPTLGTYSGTQLQGVIIMATALNTTGCITLRFRSNTAGTGMFTASATCTTPCATPTAAGIIVGGETADSTRVCVGDVVDFSGIASSAAPGFTLANYKWDFMDGSTAIGSNASHAFNAPGQYLVQLFVTDNNGCGNTNLIDLQVFVATIPTFIGFPADTTLCLGESVTFTADPDFYEVTWNGFPGSQTIDDGCLPDTLLGVSQDVQIMQTGFAAGSTITQLSDIQSLCLGLEHSFMGDLVIIVECPNGQNQILHQQGGGGTQIGEPNPLDNVDCSDPTTQGIPYTYCFTPTATETWVDWSNNNGFGGTLPAGNYEPIQPFTNLVGCPLNG
ncbi:PKD domain-containing protein, partial [Fluviicola sp.]|uniref:PKD domain-containing protein n=1 Tax=Fluviicola sp. TaxID=1917219 RepID=UPI0026076AFC